MRHHYSILSSFARSLLGAAALASGITACSGAQMADEDRDALGKSSSAIVPGVIDTIRVEAVLASDDDGSNAPTITAEQIRADMAQATKDFSNANLRFTFDPQTDLVRIKSTLLARDCILSPGEESKLGTPNEPICDQTPHAEERTRVAALYPGKLVLHYAAHFVTYPDANGNWQYGPNGTNWSNGTDLYVHMGDSDAKVSHEMGHYLRLAHTFGPDYHTIEEAQNAIKAYVESNGLPKSAGYDLFDGDGLASTPPDPLPNVFIALGLDPCNVNDTTATFPVTFSDGTEFSYSFTPDRDNKMSYWQYSDEVPGNPCRGTPGRISADQVTRVREGLEGGNRSPLYDYKQQFSAVFEPDVTGQTRAISWSVGDFATRFNQEVASGKHLVHMQAYDIGGNQIRYDGVWADGAAGTTRAIAWSIDDFATRFNQEIASGKHLVHMQAYDLGGGQIRYDGAWEDGVNGTTRAIAWSIGDFATRFNQEIAAGKHFVHMQAYDLGGGQIRYDGAWEDGARGTTRAIAWSLSDFETRFNQEIASGKHLVHLQAYDVGGGQIRYDGVWETGALDTQHLFNASLAEFSERNDQEVANGRRLVKLNEYDIGDGQLRYDGVWETSTIVQTHLFSESIYRFAEGFNAQLSAGKHAVLMHSVRGR